MHILVTNDDGPPGPASPYVHALVRALQAAHHTVSVCLPDTQRSWIGKAHMIGQTVKPVYYRPPAVYDALSSSPQGTTHPYPSKSSSTEEWVLVDGTPASCAQIGLHHVFRHRGEVDLVVSGPNFGRNSTALFALSSGTLGAAMEAGACRKKAIALSYAHFMTVQNPREKEIIDKATRHSVKVIEALYRQWPEDGSVDVYTVNVPLLPGLGEGKGKKVVFTNMLQNYWGAGGTCFVEVEGSTGGEEEEEEEIRAEEGVGESGEEERKESGPLVHRHFKWKPRFEDVYQSVEDSPPGNDGWAVKEGFTSVTPIKANFWHAAQHLHGTELKLEENPNQHITQPQGSSPVSSLDANLVMRPKDHFYALVDYEDPYVQPLILNALAKLFPLESYTLLSSPSPASTNSDEPIALSSILPNPSAKVLQVTQYEKIDWDFMTSHESTAKANSYMLRKALIRKHYLASTIEHWVAKRPDSVLRTGVKRGEAFELDFAEFLDDALVEAWDLNASLGRNEERVQAGEGDGLEWWILKPGMSDRGQGIRLFATMEQLQAIFDGWEPEADSDGDDDDEKSDVQDDENNIPTSQLRHFVAQPYIDRPLLLPGDGRKFHIRTYVACVGSLEVYVYRHMLALFAGKTYVPPRYTAPAEDHVGDGDENENGEGEGKQEGDIDLEAHLTNTCLQRSVKDGSVRLFWDLDIPAFPTTSQSHSETNNTSSTEPKMSSSTQSNTPSTDPRTQIFDQILNITGEVFEAAARGMQMHFRPLSNAFEIFGLDFLVDEQGQVFLLEVNSFPDFKQTGDELRELVGGLWEGVLRRVMLGTKGVGERDEGGEEDDLVLVRRVELGW
ncbi:survival protein sure-like phosphatase/nucleotidase [Xylariaceae sp. FL1019]|nr:survival protein sure-like phosphatase/nucleotidase [Xylariaceae sp. FL1019]